MMAYTRLGSAPDTVTPALPHNPAGSPGFLLNSRQLAPPSVLLNKPPSGPPLSMLQGVRYTCQIVAYNTSGFEGSMARSTAPARSLRNNTRFQVRPPSVVL